MANSVIGSLRVDLGLNSAQFTKGLNDASRGLNRFGVQLTLGLETVANVVGQVIGAMPRAIKMAIDHADALGKAAQKAGVTVEALSRLEYAAKLSDISLESLTGGLQKLSKGMADAAGGKGPAAAFKALGIAVTDARGQLRGSDEVMREIADRFSRMEDGATKTALAMQMFGKTGAEMIPLLNEGADGLARMADESDRLGNTITTKTAKGAEKFNDTLTRISAIMQGVINKVMEAALPALQSFAETLASPEFAKAAQQLATWVVEAMNAIVQAVTGAVNALNDLGKKLFGPAGIGGHGQTNAEIEAQIKSWESDVNQSYSRIARNRALNEIAALKAILAARERLGVGAAIGGWGATAGTGTHNEPPTTKAPVFEVPSFDTGAAVASLKPLDLGLDATTEKIETLADSIGGSLTNAISGFANAILDGTNPLEAFADSLSGIGRSLMNAGIQGLVNSLLGGISFGTPSVAGWGGGLGYLDFDGGGYTWDGPRSGGLDGKGGRLAMLHSNETVLDHTRGQGGGLTMNFNITGSREDGAAIANVVREEARRVYLTMQRNPDR
jgi:hypothetical protein